ncbi:MAG: permease-like cell division protein FtsX [Schwartzia sp.]|nr:permease-like cell division protein FtsX [Schwartzia sp. (in: firmicutes)]
MKIRTSEYIITEVFHSLKRNSWMAFASVGTVAVSLFVFGMFLIIVMNMNRMAVSLESQVEISVYLEDRLTDSEIKAIDKKINEMNGVNSVTFTDKIKALDIFKERLGDQKFLLDAIEGENPLPNSFTVKVVNPSLVKTTAIAINDFEGVETVKYGQDVVEHLFDITRLIRLFGIVLMILLAGATLFIISNTIRLTVFARRTEVAIMKYVGATDWFIRWPFMLEGIVLGAMGGTVAFIALRIAYNMIVAKIYDTIAFFPLIPTYPFMTYISIIIVCCGIVIGAVGSVISLKRFLKA